MPSDFSPYKNSTTAKQASVTRSHFLEKKTLCFIYFEGNISTEELQEIL